VGHLLGSVARVPDLRDLSSNVVMHVVLVHLSD
jgi:hypothetical protein